MKKVEEMNLNECLDALRRNFKIPGFHNGTIKELSDRIEFLTSDKECIERVGDLCDEIMTDDEFGVWMDVRSVLAEGLNLDLRYP